MTDTSIGIGTMPANGDARVDLIVMRSRTIGVFVRKYLIAPRFVKA
jgi:hypothetical protein